MKQLADYKIGENIDTLLLIKGAKKGLTKFNSPYLAITLADKSGEISAMLWNVQDDDIEQVVPGKGLQVVGTISKYQDKKQINIDSWFVTELSEDDYSNLVKSAPVSGTKLYKEIYKVAETISNKGIRIIVTNILEKYAKDFVTFPAARGMHHAYTSGLAYHTWSILQLAQAVAEQYEVLNKDLLYAGVILHDIGKIKEYTGAVDTQVTLEGKLKGHISIMSEEVREVGTELNVDEETILLLQHMVLSHHGKLEWASPVVPHLIEAEVLHMLDNVDAKLDAVKSSLANVEPGTFSEPVRALGNRSFYKPNL